MVASEPRLVLETEQVAVFDDFLDGPALRAVRKYANEAGYALAHVRRWRKIFRLHDGMPLQGPVSFFDPAAANRIPEFDYYPTGTAVDGFLEALLRIAPRVSRLVGEQGRAWRAVNAAPWVYPPGCGLGLHIDAGPYTGAYTYFLHPSWHLHWGGLLVVLDDRTRLKPGPDEEPYEVPFLDDERENRRVMEPGLGLCIIPKPNRIVFINRESAHLVTKVDVAAGDRPRTSLVGSFHMEVLP